MEFPGGWTALVASLSVSDLKDPDRAWKFLRYSRLVIDTENGVAYLKNAIAIEKARGRITGGSFAYRVAEHLVEARLTQIEASARDPFAKLAARRWEAFVTADPVQSATLPNEEL